MSTRGRASLALLVATVWLLRAPAAAGQIGLIVPGRPYQAFGSLHLEGGVARNFDRRRWGLLGGATAGVGLFDGDHIWDFVAGLRGIRGDQRAVTVSASRATVTNGFGWRATALWDLDRRAAGAGAGVSFSLLNLEGDVILDGRPTTTMSLFISVPVGFLAHLALGGKR